MMKKLFIILLFICFLAPTYADTVITGGVRYDVQSARNELQSNIPANINYQEIANLIFDPYFNQNQNYKLIGNAELKDRVLAFFSDGTYAVIYNNDKLHSFYYRQNGVLFATEVKTNLDYPYKSYKYDTQGKLLNMNLRISKDETYIYMPGGQLIAHWVKENAYNESGQIIMNRKYYE